MSLAVGYWTFELEPRLHRTQSYQVFLSVKPVVGQNIALHASATARNHPFLISASMVLLTSFLQFFFKMKWRVLGTVT